MDWEVRAASLILCLGILLATIQDGIAERRIVCYYTNWSVYRPGTAKFSPQNINPYLCTHLIYAFGGFTKENALRPFDKYQDIEKGGYAKFTGLKTYNKNLKTMLAIGGWNEGSSRFSPMVADSARRREFVKNAIKFLRQNHFDGLDLDWEYPAFRDGGKPRDKDNYANLVQELREEFERESSKTGRPRLLLSMAMPAGIEYIDKGYDVPRLNEYLDFINLLSYDYHSAYEPAVNHHSPLYPLEEDNEYNYDAELTIDYTISHLLEKGASADKVVLGIPTYGRSYTLFNQDATELGSPADGPGTEGEATREKGYLAYYEICEGIAESDDWEVVKPNPKAMGPYAFKGNQWVGYDDENIVRLKARYVNEKKLGGIMFWSIDNDDFRGKCHGRPYPLIEAAKEALLADNSRNTIDKTKSVDNRKKTRTQSNTRKSNTSSRRSSTTSSPIISKRVSSSRPKYRTVSQSKSEEQDDREVSRRSYDPSSEEDTEGRNTVTVTEKIERPKNRNRSKTRGVSANRSTRRKQSRRKGQSKTDESGESLSNKLTTPEPPTTPDPGTDFKCEDEGFFPHPRDCKKYFWCLDSGPGGLGVVAHQFTCPSGLVFNKAADSCDYPRNVICPKTSKTSIVSTTRSPITAATSRTTYLHSTTTAKAESEEFDSEEEYDDDEIAESEEEEEEEEEEVKEEPTTTTTTTTKPLIYKTLTRNRPSTTTTTRTTLKSNEPEKVIDNEDEEDPKVIKELIDLIKKAGGIEELEKQLLLQEKNSNTKSGSESETPATISRSLYERVLNRQANRIGNQRPAFSSSETSYVNGPGRAQFEGLDDIPEVKSLRRSQKPQYVTIERSKSVTKESENEGIDENEEDDDSTDVASSEEKSISNPEGSSSTQRVTPSYVNIRRTRLSTTTSRTENDVEGKEVEIEEKRSTRRRRPFVSSKQQDNEASSEIIKPSRNRGLSFSFRNSEKRDDDLKSTDLSAEKDDDSSTTKSRYTNVQRFRSTTLKTSEDASSVVPLSEVINEPTLSMGIEEYPEFSSTSLPSSTPASTSTSTEVITVISVEPPENSPSVSLKNTVGSTTDSVKLVEDSATEILFTTLPAASSSSQSTTTTTTTTTTTLASRSTIATVSQPRPFGFTRRKSGSSEATTTATTPLNRSKVADSETIRLPTLKELIGYPTTYYDDHIATTSASVLLHLPRNDVDNDISRQNVDESLRRIDESQDDEKEISQLQRSVIEETGDSWLQQASENKAKSRTSRKEDTNSEEQVSVTNAIQENEDKQKKSSSSIYFLKPTTMRGIPLAGLTPSPIMRGFYITKGEDVLPSSIFTTITTTESSVQQQTETTVPDIFTTDEIVTHNDQSELGPNIPDSSANNIISDKSEGRFFTFTSSVDSLEEYPSNTENILNQEKFDLNTVDRSASKRGKSVRNFDHNTTPSFNSYVVSPTSPTRRRIALVVNRYNEASTPLWTGRRIVRKRNKTTTVSPIKDAIRRIENDSIRYTTNSLNDYLTSKSILSPRGRKFPITSTTPTIPLIASDSTSPEIANSPNNLANSNDIEDLESHATVELTMTLTNSVVTATPSISEIISTTNKPTIADISTFSDDPTTTPTIATVITTTPLIMAIAKAPTVATDARITTTTANTETETTSLHYLTTDHPTIENTNAIPTDFEITTTFAANTETEIVSANPAVPPITRTISTDSTNTETPNADNIEIETTSMTSYSTITIPTTADTQEVATDSENMTTDQVTNADISTIFTIANYSTIPTTTNTYDVITDSTISIEPPNTEFETASTIGNYSTLTTTGVNNTRATTTIPATATALLTTIISSTVNAPVHITAPVTTNNLADADTVTANEITTNTPLNIITPTNADLNEVTTSANANIFSTSAIGDILPITNRSTTNSIILSEVPNTSTDVTSMSSIISTLTTESSTIDLANPSTFNISNNSEILTVTSEFTQTTEIPTTFETTSKSISTTITLPKSLPSTNFETLSTATAALSPEEDENSSMSMITQNPSTLLSITTPITSKTNIVSERSVTSATFDESIATNSMIYTTSAYKPDLIQMINEESTISEQEIDFKKGMSVETQSQIKDQITTIINKPSIAQTTSEENTTPKMKVVSEETISKFTESQKQNRTTSEYDTINYQYNKKASRRRVVNRTNNWLGSPVTLQRTNEYPRHRVAVHRRRRPSTDISSSTENNHRRRIMRKRVRVNSEAINSTIRPHQDIVDIQNITEDQVVHNRAENVRKRMKTELNEIKEKIGEEVTTMLSTEKTTVFPQPSAIIENEHIEKKRKIIVKKLKQSQENSTTEESSTNPYFTNENPSNNSQNNLHVNKNLLQQEKPRKIMRVVLKNVKLKSEKQKLIEEASADSDSIDKNMQDNFSKSLYANNDLSDKEIVRRMRVVLKNSPISEEKNSTISKTNVDPNKNLHDNFSNNLNISQAPSNKEKIKRRMRVVLKSVKPKSEERNSTIEEINEDSDLTNKNLQNNLSNNFNTSQIFSNEDKTRRRMRVVKRIKPKSKETGIKTEEASVEHDSTNESLQGAFSNNLRNSKNLLDYGTRRRMRVVLKSIKSKSEGNITVEEVRIDSNFTNGDTFSNNSRSGKDLPLKYGSRRRTRVVLKSVRPKSEKRNSTVEEASVDSDSIDKDLQGSFSSNFHIKKNFPDKEQTRRRTGVIPRSIAAKSEEKDSIAEETNIDLEYGRVREQPQVFSTFNFSNNLYGSNNFPEKEKTMTPSKSGEEETTIKQLGVTEPRITGTSVLVEEDTDRPSLEVTTSTSIGRKSGSGTRHRKPAQFTTVAPLTNTLSNTERTSRRGRPALETTLSSRIDHVDAFEGDEAYVKPTAVLHDQNADVSSDQSVRAQKFAVTLSEPPSSSSDIGRTPLRNEDRRKISTTIAPRTDSTTSKTVSRYGADFRSRQRPRTKERPTINATARPRRPPVIDYDYYEDEVPIVVGKSVLNSKLFLTSKGTIRCLDQGNFPHPHSCKKFITCARMVNGQVIGTEYTCPDKLSFDPVGGICNWSAGLGCKD